MYLQNIPLYDNIDRESSHKIGSGFSESDIEKENIDKIKESKSSKINKGLVIKTKYNIDKIEKVINNILDKHTDKCKYYVHIYESYYCISFNVGIEQLNAMIDTMFFLYIYKNENNEGIIKIVNEKEDHPEWTSIKNDIMRGLQ